MPGIAELALILAILILLATGVVWLVHLAKRSQAEKDTRRRLKEQEDARAKEAEIEEAARRVRGDPGPVIPRLPGGTPPDPPPPGA